MRLAALYIEDNKLFEDNRTVNLGGEYIYNFKKTKDVLTLSYSRNFTFIKDLYGSRISLISAIVGGNGTGKTTILKRIRTGDELIYVYEETSKVHPRKVSIDILKKITPDEIRHFNVNLNLAQGDISLSNWKVMKISTNFFGEHNMRYYSPLSKYKSFRNFSNDFANIGGNDIVQIEKNRILKNIDFLSNRKLVNELNKVYGDLDFYKSLRVDPVEVSEDDLWMMSKNFYVLYGSKSSKLKDRRSRHDELDIDLLQDIESGVYFEDIFRKAQGTVKGLRTKNEQLRFTLWIIYILYCFNSINISLSFKEWEELNVRLCDTISDEIFINEKLFIKSLEEVLKIMSDIKTRATERFKITMIAIKAFHNIIRDKFDIAMDSNGSLIFNKVYDSYSQILQELNKPKSDFKYFGFENVFVEFNPDNDISDGEMYLIDLLSNLYLEFKNDKYKRPNWLFLLDEAELGFHPLWKKKFVNTLVKLLPEIILDVASRNIEDNIQIVFTTHDPLTLSDIPNSNIVYLEKKDNRTKIFHPSDRNRPQNSFGANIHDLLADSFFLEEGLMGEFAKTKIQKTIYWINETRTKIEKLEKKNEKLKRSNEDIEAFILSKEFVLKFEKHKKLVSIIDEPVLKIKLSEMLNELKKYDYEYQGQILQQEIDNLQKKKDHWEENRKRKE